MIIKSIRWRLQIWLAFLLVCLLSGFGITAYQLNRVSRFKQLDEELERRVAAVSADVRGRFPGPPGFRGPPGEREGGPPQGPPTGPPVAGFEGPGRPDGRGNFGGGDRRMRFLPRNFDEVIRNIPVSERTASLFDESATHWFYYAIWSRDGDLLRRTTNAPPDLGIPARPEGDISTHIRTAQGRREAYHFTEIGEAILVGRAITEELAALRRFAWLLGGVGGIVLAVGLGGGWLLTGRALQPVGRIGATASRISLGNLSERIDVAETDGELGRLAGVLNSTFARLEAAFAQQRQFTANASHELRTPLAVIISETQTALARERSADEYRETVQVCLQTAQQMRRLAESLMKLARFDAGQEILEQSPFDLAELARDCVELIRPLAEENRLSLRTHLAPAEARGDADRCAQVVTNLLANAIQFNQPGGQIEVTTRVEGGLPTLLVRDTGQGIAAEDLPHIFERFFRADKSRSRRDGHAGLGLAIAKSIVEAHGGSISVVSAPGAGATFKVQLPAEPGEVV